MIVKDLKPNYDSNGLVPAIIQDESTKKVLMLGYMNQEALEQTLKSDIITFYSRSKQRLWTKGESSGNFLHLKSISNDCDGDALLIQVQPQGPTCHTGADTCWQEENSPNYGFITQLEQIINSRFEQPSEGSYVQSLIKKGINKIAQKVGEEAIEVVIEAKDSNDELFLNESADLLFHYLILLRAKGFKINDVVTVLNKRN
jgi:phosphoribosyl-AMP cyclohydrolase / phosphoribosyl-ATP pyrophosphohydrolase